MRWRIGLLQDAASAEKQATREAAQDAAKKAKQSIPTVKTEAQMKVEEEAAAKAAKEGSEPPKPKSKPKIRPLSEAKAIESGANFISETFLFGVAAGLIFFESWRSRRKETNRRDDVAERLADLEDSERSARRALVELEREVLHLRAKEHGAAGATKRILPREVYEAEAKDEEAEEKVSQGWLSRIASFISSRDTPDKEAQEALKTNAPGPAEKILVNADKEIDQKRKQRDIEAQQPTATANSVPSR
jgi:optic atrophy 3 protein